MTQLKSYEQLAQENKALQARVFALEKSQKQLTECAQVEEALRRSEERYRIISELISDYAYSFRITSDNQILGEWTTDSFERMTGYTPQEIDTRHDNLLYMPEDRERVKADVEAVLKGKVTVGDYRIRTKGGEERWLRISRYPVWDQKEERVVRFYGAAQDITESKKLEQQMIELAIEKQRMQVLADFVRDISHDLRTPMTIITTCLYVIQRTQDAERRQEKIKTVEQSIFYLNRVLTQLQEMAVLDSLTHLTLNAVPIQAVVMDAVTLFDKSTTHKNIIILTDFESNRIQVNCDQMLLQKAIEELIDNAIRFANHGSIIRVHCRMASQNQVMLTIADNGIGIHSDDLTRIFERFFKANKSRNLLGGAGIGLPKAKHIIELHNGTIEIESVMGQGTTCKILLPSVL